MSELQHINREAAENLMSRYLPMFAEFDERGIDYCLVGGLAVVAQCLAHDANGYRATIDADALVAQDYSNADFAKDYLRVYAADPDVSKAVYEAVFGEDGFERLSDDENAFVNASFVGADEDLDGVDTPDFDVCRMLNGRTLATVKRERLKVLGHDVWVATVDELLDMKRGTIAIYGVDIQTNPRPQDFVDVGILNGLLGDGDGESDDDWPGMFAGLRQLLGGR